MLFFFMVIILKDLYENLKWTQISWFVSQKLSISL